MVDGCITAREKYNSQHKPLLEKLKETWGQTPETVAGDAMFDDDYFEGTSFERPGCALYFYQCNFVGCILLVMVMATLLLW